MVAHQPRVWEETAFATLRLEAGRWYVRREDAFLWFDGKRYAVDIDTGEKVTRTLSRKGLRAADG